MITFKLSFILAFSLKPPEEKVKPKKKQKGKKGKQDKSKKTKSKKGKQKKEKKEKVVPPPVEKPNYLFEVDKIIAAAHIDYELVPGKSKYQIDVVCWGPVAKVFTNDGQQILKTFIRDEKAWVPVCIKHYSENLNIEEIKKYQKHVVKFNITSNMKKVGKLAKADKTKKFYAYKEEAESSDFVEMYDQDPNLEEKTSEQRRREGLEKMIKDIIIDCGNCPTDNIVSWLHYPYKFDIFHDIIRKQYSGMEVESKDFIPTCPLPVELAKPVKAKPEKKRAGKKEKKQKKGKKGKKGKKQKKPVNDTVLIPVPAEVFFTDPLLATYKAVNDGLITNVFILLSAKHLLTRVQKFTLNPLVIKIKKLSKLPVNVLSDMGIRSIYVSYQIPWIANCKSIEKPVKERIKFNEAHIFFNDDVPKIKLIEFIETRKLIVEIYGIKDIPPPQKSGTLFGKEKSDEEFSQLYSKYKYKEDAPFDPNVLLAVSTFDLSSLAENVWDFQEKGQCHAPGQTLFQKVEGCYGDIMFTDKENMVQINLDPNYARPKGHLPEDVLQSFGTTLKMEVYLMAPQAAALTLNQVPNTFKRIFAIMNDEEQAKNILIEALQHNMIEFSKVKDVEDKKSLENVDILTGFVIDNGNSFAFFIEGISVGFMLTIWHLVEKCEASMGKFFLNTDNAFEQRLYQHFLSEGLYFIALKIPLQDILAEPRLYLRGNIPPPCLEALKKIFLLCHSFLFSSILKYGLLPKPVELISLNLEWGVPEKWRLQDHRKSVIPIMKSFTALHIS